MPSMRELAAGTEGAYDHIRYRQTHGPIRSLAQDVSDKATALLQEAAPLDEDIDSALAQILCISAPGAGNKHPRQAVELIRVARQLRGVYSLALGEYCATPYMEDVLSYDINDVTLPLYVVPELHKGGLGPDVYGEATTDQPVLPLRGLIWGQHSRPFVTMILQYGNNKVQLPMFINTGGHTTCLNRSSWAALAPNLDVSSWSEHESRSVKVHGHDMDVFLGRGRLDGVNMVGQEWLKQAGALLVVGYRSACCAIMLDTAADRAFRLGAALHREVA